MEQENNNELNAVIKRRDTLLVLHHSSSTIGMVEGVDRNGELKDSSFKEVGSDQRIHLAMQYDSFAQMFSEFYHQLRDPSDFSFFKVTEYHAQQAVIDLQQYVDQASEKEKELLKDYEVSKNGNKYQGYLRFDKAIGKFEFSFRNVWKKEEDLKKASGKSKGRKL